MNESTKTKKALRGSLFALFLCIVLLIGTTFAWFTDTASTGVNKIQAGNLDVELQYNDNGTWKNAEGQILNFKTADNRPADQILWEPGCTYELPELRVVNNGNLALKYKLKVTGIEGDKKLNEVIDWTMTTSNKETFDIDREHSLAAKNGDTAAFDTFTLKGHMQESAGNEYQNESIEGISITVYATQDTVENDSFNNQYDKDATTDFTPVSSTDELKAVFKDAKAGENVNVSLTKDVTISNNELAVVNETQSGIGVGVGDININANGHTIKTTNSGTRCVKIECSDTVRNITISNAKIVSESTVGNTSENRGIQIFSVNNATINLNNCNIEMKSKDYSYPIKIGGTSENLTINIKGCTLTGANCIESFGKNCTVNITNCILNSNYAPNETYCGNGIQDKNGTNNTYNIKNTTFNGTNAQPWQKSTTTTINDLGGNVYKTTRTTK